MNTIVVSLLFLCLTIAPARAGAESAGSLVQSGNTLYGAGDYDKALEAYEKALGEQPQSSEILFNQGGALFQRGEYGKARQAFEASALHAQELSLEASAHYNLGNTAFAQGERQLGTAPREALSQWEQSVRHYQEALRLAPQLEEAAQNIEVVRLRMKDLADRIEQAEKAAGEQREEAPKELQGERSSRDAQAEAATRAPESSHGDAGQRPNPEAGSQAEEREPGNRGRAAPRDEAGEGKSAKPAPGQQSGDKELQADPVEDGARGDAEEAAFSESPESILREEKENRLQLHRARRGGAKAVEKDW